TTPREPRHDDFLIATELGLYSCERMHYIRRRLALLTPRRTQQRQLELPLSWPRKKRCDRSAKHLNRPGSGSRDGRLLNPYLRVCPATPNRLPPGFGYDAFRTCAMRCGWHGRLNA